MSSPSEIVESMQLVDLVSQLHDVVTGLRRGDTHVLTPDALSQLVADTASLYGAACMTTGHAVPIAPHGLSTTNAVSLITALMDAENLNTFDLSLWQTPTGDHAKIR
jgi:hypothetical protein